MRIVEYYVSSEYNLKMSEVTCENPKKTAKGKFHGFGHRIEFINEQYFQITEALIEQDNGMLIKVPYNQVIRFVD